MNLRVFYTVSNDIYTVAIHTEDWSEGDVRLMVKFGEPEVDLGGDFTVPTFSLDNNLVKIKSESPFTYSFDMRDYADSDDRAESWATEIKTRITSAVTTLRTLADAFTREEVTNV